MLAIIVGAVLILGGIGWALLSWFAAGMSDSSVNTWRDVGRPALFGFVVALLGVAIIYFR